MFENHPQSRILLPFVNLRKAKQDQECCTSNTQLNAMFSSQMSFVRFQSIKVAWAMFTADPDSFMNRCHVNIQVSFVTETFGTLMAMVMAFKRKVTSFEF